MGTSMTARGSRTQTRPVLTALVPFSASSITTVSLTYIHIHTIDINPIFLSSHQSNALKSCPLSKRPTTSVSKQSVVSVHLTRAPALPGTVLHPPTPRILLGWFVHQHVGHSWLSAPILLLTSSASPLCICIHSLSHFYSPWF